LKPVALKPWVNRGVGGSAVVGIKGNLSLACEGSRRG
jgi:hypothetical protein